MKLFFVGTGSGITSLKRFHSSVLFQCQTHNLLIDAGDGIARALKSSGVDYHSIDSILISHLHADHYSGLAALVTQMKLEKRTRPLNLFVHKNFVGFIKSFLESSLMFQNVLNFELSIKAFGFENEFLLSNCICLRAKQNSHLEHKEELPDEYRDKFVSASFLISIDDINIFYTSDIGEKKDLYLFENENIDILVAETTHVNFEDIDEAARQQKIAKTFLMHIQDDDEIHLMRRANEINTFSDRMVWVVNDGEYFEPYASEKKNITRFDANTNL